MSLNNQQNSCEEAWDLVAFENFEKKDMLDIARARNMVVIK